MLGTVAETLTLKLRFSVSRGYSVCVFKLNWLTLDRTIQQRQQKVVDVQIILPFTVLGYFDTIHEYLDNSPTVNQVSDAVSSLGSLVYDGVQNGYETVAAVMPKSGLEFSGDFSGESSGETLLDNYSGWEPVIACNLTICFRLFEGSAIEPVGPISDRNETVSEEKITMGSTLVQPTVESRDSSCPSITFNLTLIIFILLTI